MTVWSTSYNILSIQILRVSKYKIRVSFETPVLGDLNYKNKLREESVFRERYFMDKNYKD